MALTPAQTQKKSAAQLAKEAKEKLAVKTAKWHNAARKQGEGVSLTFIRQIRFALDCDTSEAERVLAAAVNSGEIERVRTNEAGDVWFYRMKK